MRRRDRRGELLTDDQTGGRNETTDHHRRLGFSSGRGAARRSIVGLGSCLAAGRGRVPGPRQWDHHRVPELRLSGSRDHLLIMGVGGQLTQWPAELPAELVKRGYRVVAYDNRDAGLSTRFDSSGVPDCFGMVTGPGRSSPGDGWATLTPEERERFRRGIAQARQRRWSPRSNGMFCATPSRELRWRSEKRRRRRWPNRIELPARLRLRSPSPPPAAAILARRRALSRRRREPQRIRRSPRDGARRRRRP